LKNISIVPVDVEKRIPHKGDDILRTKGGKKKKEGEKEIA